MIEDGKIIELFFRRSEQAIRELDEKYGKVCRKLSHNIVNNRQDAEESMMLIWEHGTQFPRQSPARF